jgi:acyl dehydratase
MSKVITDDALALIDVEQSPVTIEVDKSSLKKFAQAVKSPQEPNPLYHDESYAQKTKWGGIIAAPTFGSSFTWLGQVLEQVNPTMGKYRVGLNGGNEYESFRPIRPGDVLTTRPKLASLKEKPRDDGGVMLILAFQADFYNQQNEKVLTARQTLLRIYGPENLQ